MLLCFSIVSPPLGRSMRSSSFAAYFARMSHSRFTRSPGFRVPSVVLRNVCGTIVTPSVDPPRLLLVSHALVFLHCEPAPRPFNAFQQLRCVLCQDVTL